MKSLSTVGLGLSLVFGCLLFALIAEIYYLLWWKRRITGRVIEDDDGNPAREFLYIFCCKRKKRPFSLRSTTQTSQELRITPNNDLAHQSETGFHLHTNKDLYHLEQFDENCVESGLMLGPPRFLFTINEETKEDLESEDGKSNKIGSKRLSDLMRNNGSETPYMTPLSSPAFFTPPMTPSIGINGYNPLYESSTDVEFNKMRCSPPPMFKFLRDAEDKLWRKKTMEEAAKSVEEDGSFVTIIVADHNKGLRQPIHQYQSSTSSLQVLPFPSTPDISS